MKTFLKKNTLVREELINLKLNYELKRAAALRGYHLKTYPAQVDIEGFDLIIDDDDLLRKIQIKTKVDSTTSSWDIHRTMFRPSWENFTDYEFNSAVGCPKDPSGVLLLDVKINSKNEIELDYYYTDIHIIRALEIGVFSTNKKSLNHANKILNELRYKGKSHDTIALSLGMFIKVKSAQAFLALAGFHTNDHTFIDYHLWQLSKKLCNPEVVYTNKKERVKDIKIHWDIVQEEIKKLKAKGFSLTMNSRTKMLK